LYMHFFYFLLGSSAPAGSESPHRPSLLLLVHSVSPAANRHTHMKMMGQPEILYRLTCCEMAPITKSVVAAAASTWKKERVASWEA
jgi:hypothetical protein